MLIHRLHALALALMLAVSPALASQNSLSSPTGGTVSGLQLTNNYNAAIDSVNTCNSGGSAPTNQLSGLPSLGNCWWNTSTNAYQYFDGTSWVPLGWFDTANHYWQALTGGGTVNTVASATTTDPCSTKPTTIKISGTTTITGLGSNCQVGQIKKLIFTGVLTFTHNGTSLILPNGGSNITTAAGDIAEAVYLGSGNWQVTSYVLANGQPLNTSGVAVGTASLLSSAVGMNSPLNLQLNATVASNNLTVAVKGVNGSDPSPTNPVLVAFRDTTAANGTTIFGSIQAALSMTVNAGNGLGSVSGVPARVWIELICQTQSGTTCTSILLGVSVQSNATSCLPLVEGNTVSTGPGNAGGATLGTIYTSVASLSGKAMRIAGYVEITEATAGTWATGATLVHVFGLGDRKPCEEIQRVVTSSTTSHSEGTGTPSATNLTGTLTLTSAANLVDAFANSTVETSVNGVVSAPSIQRKIGGGGFTQILVGPIMAQGVASGTLFGAAPMATLDAPGSISQLTYTVFIANTGTAGGAVWGPLSNPQTMILKEIMG